MQKKCPCEKCITLPVCKEIYNRYSEEDFHGIFLTKLTIKCTIIKSYIVKDETKYKIKYIHANVEAVLDFFGNK